MLRINRKVISAISISLVTVFGLSACGSKSAKLEIINPVARSIDSASYKDQTTGKWMTGSFMTIKNSGGSDVNLVGGSSPDAGRIEIHEVVNGEMVPKAGGVTIPAKESIRFRMGGYHVMLMDLNKAIIAGDEVSVTLEFSDGQSLTYSAPVKDIAMDDEIYGVATSGMDKVTAIK